MSFIPVLVCLIIVFGVFIKAEVNIEEKKDEILLQHNRFRRMHGIPDLEMDPELSAAAQKWADSLAQMDDTLTRRTRTKYGENLWMVEGAQLEDLMHSDLNPVKDWYNERELYPGHFDNATFPKYGHFSQIIWNNTKELGVGIAQSSTGNIFVVCNYYPKGNIIEKFQDNIHPLLEKYVDKNGTMIINAHEVKGGNGKAEVNHLNWALMLVCVGTILLR